MSTFGVTSQGFVTKPLETCLEEIQDAFRAAFGANVDLSPSEPLGQVVGITAEREVQLWELAEGVYNAFTPEASGIALDNLGALTGAPRLPATRSTVIEMLIGTASTIVPAGAILSVAGAPSARFRTLSTVTLTAATAWTTNHAYTVGQRVTAGGKLYECRFGATSAPTGTGPSGEGDAIADGPSAGPKVLWAFIAAGSAFADVACEAIDTGPIPAPTRSLSVKETVVPGWNTAINLTSATPGSETETDEDYRRRRVELLDRPAAGTVDAIRAAVRDVTGVSACRVFENTAATADVDGVPAKAIEVVADGGSDADIAQAIWDNKPAGIQSYGTNAPVSLEDAEGTTVSVRFTRPTPQPTYVRLTVARDLTKYPDTTESNDRLNAALIAAVKEWAADSLTLGTNVVPSRLSSLALKIDGVEDASAEWSADGSSWFSSIRAIGPRQRATIALSTDADIVIVRTNYVP